MARKKSTPKPLMAVKHDFVDSLDEAVQQSVFLISTIEALLNTGAIQGEPAQILRDAVDDFRAAISADE